jgi:hypothetical protein
MRLNMREMQSVVHDETAGVGARCAACRRALRRRSTGRPPRFCGGTCRSSAHRRRQQGLSESMPRWASARGRLSLRRARTWRARGAALARRRECRRRARADLAAQRLAQRRWRAASAALTRLQRDAVATATWPAINAAARRVAEAAAECRRLEAPGADWGNELRRAIEAANLAERQSRSRLAPESPDRPDRDRPVLTDSR